MTISKRNGHVFFCWVYLGKIFLGFQPLFLGTLGCFWLGFFWGVKKTMAKVFQELKKGFIFAPASALKYVKNTEGKGRKFIEKIETTARIERYETN